MNKSHLFLLSSLLVCLCFWSCATDCCTTGATKIDFEDLSIPTTFAPNIEFISGGQTFLVKTFSASNGSTISNGHVLADQGQFINPRGVELNLSNINLRPKLSSAASCVSFMAINKGGNLNIEINGDFKNFAVPSDIDGTTLGGVSISAGGGSNVKGLWQLTGVIENFYVGGQEFYIDDLCIN